MHPNEQTERPDKHCQEMGQSKNGFIKSAIDEKLNRKAENLKNKGFLNRYEIL